MQKPAACLLRAIQEEWLPNVAEEHSTREEREFDEWYAQAIQQGFVLDLPKNYLGEVEGEIQVKVKDCNAPCGYINMGWWEAKEKMEKQAIISSLRL